MNKQKLKQLRSLILEMEEEIQRQHTQGAWSLFHDNSLVIERNKKSLDLMARQIEEIPDCLVRRAIKLRYVDGKSWAEVSFKMGYTSSEGARMLVNRYFEKTSV